MTRGTRVLWIVIGGLAVCAMVGVAALATAVHAVQTMPMIEVSVHEKGGDEIDLHFTIPAAVVGAGLTVAPHVVPDEAWEEMRMELAAELSALPAEWRAALDATLDELERAPDFRLVEVDDGDEHVRVDKVDGHLRVTVRSPDADVDVRVPLRLVRQVSDLFADAAQPAI